VSIQNGHYWQIVAHLFVDKSVDSSPQALYLPASKQVRKKLHTTVQLLAQKTGQSPDKISARRSENPTNP
jgi:hypothetical protein